MIATGLGRVPRERDVLLESQHRIFMVRSDAGPVEGSMLSKEENEALTRVGPGTLMGDLMRQYWLPFLYSSEVEADGPPLRVRLLGEDLIVFRDSAGKLGLLGTHCPHRGASLFFGRNEEEGLRCVYHGWKFDIEGQCIDMPNEPRESMFRD